MAYHDLSYIKGHVCFASLKPKVASILNVHTSLLVPVYKTCYLGCSVKRKVIISEIVIAEAQFFRLVLKMVTPCHCMYSRCQFGGQPLKTYTS